MITNEQPLEVTVVGGGYVGLSLSCLLAENNNVILLDIDPIKTDKINSGITPIMDLGIKDFLEQKKPASLYATADAKEAYSNADIVFIAVPTNYDEELNSFDTSLVENVINDILQFGGSGSDCPIIVIKSTVPVGFTDKMRSQTGYSRILFCPEFLREGRALYDGRNPSRIIIGTDEKDGSLTDVANCVLDLLLECCETKDCPTLITGSSEAEAIKLFSNAYLALRVSFFNELDSFAEAKDLNSGEIICGMGMDPRIGNTYNNPSFGYGGYCLPKDTRQLLSQFSGVPHKLMKAIVESNEARIDHIASQILAKAREAQQTDASGRETVIGVYRINMKTGSDNYRQSASLEVLKRIAGKGFPIEIYEPLFDDRVVDVLPDCKIQNDLERFKSECGIILANRFEPCLEDVKDKVYTRDQFHIN